MGQKTNPIGFRTGITQNWQSRWFASNKDFGRFVVEDFKIRELLKNEYRRCGISRIEIERLNDLVRIFLYTSNPGLIIGRRGAKVEQISMELEKITNKKVDLKINEIERPEIDAQIVAEAIAEQLEKRAQHRRVMRRAVEVAIKSGALGAKVLLSGRIAGTEIARDECISIGKIPLQTLNADISYGVSTAILTKGTIGIKVWIFRGIKNEVNAQKS